MSSNSIQLIFGGASIGPDSVFGSSEKIEEAFDILQEGGVKAIDTATIYVESEDILGKANAAARFTIDTKYPGGWYPEPSTKETVIATADASLKKLQTDHIDIYYIHSPDRRARLEDMLDAINTLYKDGKIKRFGLSNFLAKEVEEVIRISQEKNYILPSVYQGNYSAVARRQEKELFPVLRKHGIAFYAYSPIAGGFLTKDVDQLLAGGQGRWDKNTQVGALYHALYNKPSMMEGLRLWEKISKESGISKVELAYRWVVYNSGLKSELGDGLIFGASRLEQLKHTVDIVKRGPLSREVVEKIEEVWKIVEAVSPLDNYNVPK